MQSLLACGKSQTAISHELNVPLSTVHLDVVFLRAHAREYVKRYDETFAEQYLQCINFLDQVMAESWKTATNIKYERNKVSALALCKDCLLAKAALISDIGLIDRSVAYVEHLKKKRKRALIIEDDTNQIFAEVLPEDDYQEQAF